MDIATIIGLVAAGALIFVPIFTGPGVGFFFSFSSFLIVVGGTFGATLVAFPLNEVLGIVGVIKKAFTFQAIPYSNTIDMIVNIAEKARREGILAIEREIDGLDDQFMKSGVQYAVDGTEPETIRSILESEIASMEDRHKAGQALFETMGTYGPAFGMIGTLIGLIQMLSALSDPSQIGAGMAVALVTTLYGSMLANVIFLPMKDKLGFRSKEEVKRKELIVEGILAIQSGDNPRIVREKLLTFLPPKERSQEERMQA